MAEKLPNEIAREALQRLAQSRLPPTPGNYAAMYQEISGTEQDASVFEDRQFKAIIGALPRQTPEQVRIARQLGDAVNTKSWNTFGNIINDLAVKTGSPPLPWTSVIRGLITQLETRTSGLT